MKYPFLKLLLLASLFATALCEITVQADDCSGYLWKARRDGVPLYRNPDQSFPAGRLLSVGERVCVVGEQGEFSIIQALPPHHEVELEGERLKLLFVRKVELIAIRGSTKNTSPDKRSALQKLRDHIASIQSGVIPEDGLLPYQWIVDLIKGE